MPTRDRATSSMMCCSAPCEKSKSLGSGGSMVARLKLKGIDGRAPPGVNRFTAGRSSSAPNSSPKGGGGSSPSFSNLNASPPFEGGRHPQIAGELLKLCIPSLVAKARGGQVNSLGYGNKCKDATMDDPQPRP